MGKISSISAFKAKAIKKISRQVRKNKKPGPGHVATRKAAKSRFVGGSACGYEGPSFYLKKVPAYCRKAG